ncbi:MAG TPA: pilus assembly protein PilM [Tepidisphaeraceae bacterium]|jgi:type IV pilus assembly protein PilM|nr:pilus assembly protein PilM [Tepidisphaeraceae bacterium]
MFSFVQNWFTPSTSPIGVDFGSDCLRLAQVEQVGDEYQIIATAAADVPPHVRNDTAGRSAFFTQTIRDLLVQGGFKGRKVVLNLPASMIHLQHLRVPKMEDEALKKALAWEARGKLPFDPSHAVLRHQIAGEIYQDQEPKYEVILMAARKDLVEQYLAAANKARLQVAGMNVEPKAVIDCFSHIYHRKSDFEATTFYIDIGCGATRAVIAREGRIRFARNIPVGGEHFTRAVATAMRISQDEARMIRVRLAAQGIEEGAPRAALAATPGAGATPEKESLEGTGFALLNAAVAAAERREPVGHPTPAPAEASDEVPAGERESGQLSVSPLDRDRVEEACREPLARLIEELTLCRRYYESAFHDQPLKRLIFVGGEANQRGLCQQIARALSLPAQIGDPFCRMSKTIPPDPQVGIDRRLPQPAWTVAVGLSMGPAVSTVAKAS